MEILEKKCLHASLYLVACVSDTRYYEHTTLTVAWSRVRCRTDGGAYYPGLMCIDLGKKECVL